MCMHACCVYVSHIQVESLQMQGKMVDNNKLSTQLFLHHGCIEEESVDVIVNPTTHDFDLSSNPESQAICKKAGLRLQMLCHQLSESGKVVNENNSVFTEASGQLRCKKVLHVYTPMKSQSQTDTNDVKSVIHSAVLDALNRTEEEGYKSLSLPLLGHDFPVESRTKAVIEASLKFGEGIPSSVNEIRLVLRDKGLYDEVCCCFAALKEKYFGQCSNVALEVEEVLELHPRSRVVSKQVHQSVQPWNAVDLKVLENNDAVVKVYSTVPNHGSWVIQDIESKVSNELTTQCIQNDHVHELIESDLVAINHTLGYLGVAIDVKKEEKKIILSGEKNKVCEAQAAVMKLLNSLQHANLMLNQFVWQRETNDCLELYPKDVSLRLEMAQIQVSIVYIHTYVNINTYVRTFYFKLRKRNMHNQTL